MRLALSGQGVTEVRRILVKRDGKVEPTNTFILTFGLPSIPAYITAAYMKVPVELYIPNPLRCYSCQKFGHGQSTCNRQAVCAKCAEHGHLDSVCPNNARCANCRGPHTAYSKDCPEWNKQREINTVKFTRNVSFSEAKNIVDKQAMSNVHPATLSGISYAKVAGGGTSLTKVTKSVTSQSTQSVEVQTDYTWPPDTPSPILLPQSSSATAVQTESIDDIVLGAVGGLPAASSSNTKKTTTVKPNTTTLKTGIVGQKPGPSSSKKTIPSTPSSPKKKTNRLQKGTGDIIKLANKYSSLNEMAMDLGGVPNTSPNRAKHK